MKVVKDKDQLNLSYFAEYAKSCDHFRKRAYALEG
jgi:hypothetical protein